MMSVLDSTIDEKKAACKVCSSTYKGIEDKRYVKDMVTFGSFGLHREKAFHVVKNYMKVHPDDKFSLQQLLILTQSGDREFYLELKNRIESKIDKGDDSFNSNLAKSIISFSKGNHQESALYLSKINSLPFSQKDGLVKDIQESLRRDLFFLSLSNPNIKLSNRSLSSLDTLFKSSSTKFNAIINENKF